MNEFARFLTWLLFFFFFFAVLANAPQIAVIQAVVVQATMKFLILFASLFFGICPWSVFYDCHLSIGYLTGCSIFMAQSISVDTSLHECRPANVIVSLPKDALHVFQVFMDPLVMHAQHAVAMEVVEMVLFKFSSTQRIFNSNFHERNSS